MFRNLYLVTYHAPTISAKINYTQRHEESAALWSLTVEGERLTVSQRARFLQAVIPTNRPHELREFQKPGFGEFRQSRAAALHCEGAIPI